MKQFNMFGGIDDAKETKYTKKLQAPIYKPRGKKPHLLELYDKSKTNRLIREINISEIDDDIKEFLIEAARRHTIFNYEKIADYYANANKEVQELMERSALVIIDFEDAIKYGFTKLSNRMVQEYLNDKSVDNE